MNSLDRIAITIDLEGFDALDRATLDGVLALATAAEASPVLTEVFGDDHEPAPVRERAFGLLAMQIASRPHGPDTHASTRARRLHRDSAASVQSDECSSLRTRSRRSRVPVPVSGADSRSNWPVEAPVLR